MALFVGNVLPDMTTTRGEGDVTFDFDESEARSMDLTGVPIRIEHEESLAVGKVLRCWDGDNGEKWIVGQMNDNTIESRFASHAIRPTTSGGYTLYKGLSLQHVWRGHKASNGRIVGRGEKRPVEISVCADPRRPNCYIRHVASTDKMEYKAPSAGNHTMSAEPETTPAPAETTPAEAAEAAPAETAEVPTDPNALYQVILDGEAERTKLQNDFEKQAAELAALKKEKAERAAQEQEQEKAATAKKAAVNENLAQSILDTWRSQLPAEDLTEDVERVIRNLATNFPQQSKAMFELTHKASKRSVELERELKYARQQAERAKLEAQVAAVLSKKRSRTTTIPQVEEEIHRASKRSAPTVAPAPAAAASNPFLAPKLSSTGRSIRDNNPQLFEALASLGGNARSHMEAIANIGQ